MASLLDRRQLNMSTKKKLLEAAAGNAGGDPVYVDDVFSTYLYEGNGGTKSIDNGIDLSGEGGLVWIKERTRGTTAAAHAFTDTERGAGKVLASTRTDAEYTTTTSGSDLTSFNSNGFSLGPDQYYYKNQSSQDYVSWTFRKAPGFFDVVTISPVNQGGGTQTFSHNLGAVPGMMLVKASDVSGNWSVYHSSKGYQYRGLLNTSNAFSGPSDDYFGAAPTDTEFTLGSDWGYQDREVVVYLFAHDAQDFGTDSDEAIIKCGSYTGNGSSSGVEVDLGFEPQWLFVKMSSHDGYYSPLVDSMRGIVTGGNDAVLWPNVSAAEYSADQFDLTSSGFIATDTNNTNMSGKSYIYMAIRRPHKPAEEFAATDLFNTVQGASSTENPGFNLGFAPDMAWEKAINGSSDGHYIGSRLTSTGYMFTNAADAETQSTSITWDYMNGWVDYFNGMNAYNAWGFKRAPGYFDVVAYDGFVSNGGSGSKAHNLNAVPEMMIFKNRSSSYSWYVWHKDITAQRYIRLNENYAETNFGADWVSADADNINFGYGHFGASLTGETYVAYLFASAPGISKVGIYTGTGNDLNVDCGFSAGARFILIKRKDSTGDWYYWDSLRGIVAGNDPYLLLNTNTAQVTNTDYIDPLSSGFTVTASAPAALNASGGTYIFLAIAQEYQL